MGSATAIFEYITRPRIAAAVTGETTQGKAIEGDYKFTDEFPMADGFAENVEFFRIDYLMEPSKNNLNGCVALRHASCTPLIV